jgi:hypothetical protein
MCGGDDSPDHRFARSPSLPQAEKRVQILNLLFSKILFLKLIKRNGLPISILLKTLFNRF